MIYFIKSHSLASARLFNECKRCLPATLAVFGIANEAEKGTQKEKEKKRGEERTDSNEENEREWHQHQNGTERL